MSSQNNDTFNEVKEIGIDAYLARQQDKSLLRMLCLLYTSPSPRD